MPISGNATYIPTANSMLAHWSDANTALGSGGPVVTTAGLTRAGLETLRDAVETELNAVIDAVNEVELARHLQAAQKTRVRDLVGIFNETVRSRLAATAMPAALPDAPSGNDSPAVVADAAKDAANLWIRIDGLSPIPGFTAPLILLVPPAGDPEGDPIDLPLEDFQAALGELTTLAGEFRTAEQTATLARARRDRAKKRLADGMRDYRAAIPGRFTAADPIRQSLPDLYPPPGSTPDAVTATAAWDPAPAKGRIAFDASTTAAVTGYELRYCPGPEYHTDDEITVATTPAAGPLEFLTLTGLSTPGSTALFRVYAITPTGNESGSNTVSVTRPA